MAWQFIAAGFVFGLMAAYGQEHSVTQGDIYEGGRTYRRSCIGCHGGEGSSVTGIDLGRGKYRTAVSDEDLIRVIINGVPGTGMPATQMSDKRASMVVVYFKNLRNFGAQKSIAAATGDAMRGKNLFEGQAGCAGCHRIAGVGGRSGPDLSEVGHLLRSNEIEEAILSPDAQYPMGSRPVKIGFKSGSVITGMLLNQDTYSLQIVDQEGSLRSLDRGKVKEVLAVKSWMPDFRGKFTPQELADLIAYLALQRGTL